MQQIRCEKWNLSPYIHLLADPEANCDEDTDLGIRGLWKQSSLHIIHALEVKTMMQQKHTGK